MKNTLQLTLLVLIMLLSANSPLLAQTKVLVDVNKKFPGIKKIEVSGGALEVEFIGQPGSTEVSVDAYLESNNYNQDIIFVTLGDVLKISHQNNGNVRTIGNIRNQGHIKIKGPENMELNFKGGSGKMVVENVKSAETYLSVGSGMVQARNISGDLTAKSGSGSLKLYQIGGDLKCSIGSGSGDIQGVKGSLTYNSTSGNLKVSDVDGIVSVSLTSGSAKLSNIAELGTFKLSSGSVRAENAGLGPNTNLHGSSGSFRIQTPSNLKNFNYSLKASSGSLKVGSIKTGRSLEIDNGSPHLIQGSISSGSIFIDN